MKSIGVPATGATVFKIGDLAREFGVTLRTLRFYEDRGLIHPGRSGTTRLYGAQDRERLMEVLLAPVEADEEDLALGRKLLLKVDDIMHA